MTVLKITSKPKDEKISELTDMLNEVNPNNNTFFLDTETSIKPYQSNFTFKDGQDLISQLTPKSDWDLKAQVHNSKLILELNQSDYTDTDYFEFEAV